MRRALLLFGPGLLACSTTAPNPSRLLHIEGHVHFGTPWVPERVIFVTARVYGTGDFALALDSTGRYHGDVGPLPSGVADSLLILIAESTCSRNYYVLISRYQIRITDGPLVIPPQELPPTGSPTPIQAGVQLCGQIAGGFMDEAVQLLLIVDSLTPAVYGRYRAIHRVSCDDQRGTFVAAGTSGSLTLRLIPDPGQAPLDLTVSVPFSADSLVSIATIAGSDATDPCFIPTGRTYLYPY